MGMGKGMRWDGIGMSMWMWFGMEIRWVWVSVLGGQRGSRDGGPSTGGLTDYPFYSSSSSVLFVSVT